MRSDRLLSAAVVALLLAAGCRSVTPPATPPPVWPAPPAAPRVAFVAALGSPADFGIRPSAWARAVNWIAGGDRGREPWVCPFGVSLGDDGSLCFTDTGRREVVWVDVARTRMARWDRVGALPLEIPVGVCVASGRVYVADSGLGRVLIADPQGAPRGELSFEFQRPVALAAACGRIYVADAVACCVQVFAGDGAWLRTVGGPGDGPGELNRPTHVAVDARGQVYVTDSLNCRVQVYDAEGRPLRSIGKAGDSSGHFGRPKGVAVDGHGNILVVDGLYEVIQIFDPAGHLAMDFGGAGHAAGEFWLPAGLAADAKGQLIVADSYNQRLQVFRLLPAAAAGAP